MQKLRHLNAEYIRDMSVEQFLETAKPYIAQTVKSDCNLMLLAEVLQKRCEILTDIPEQVDFIDEMPEYDIDMYNNKKMKTNPENSKTSLEAVLPVLEAISEADWTMENIHEKLFALIAELEVKNGIVLYPLRVALSGKAFTPGGGIELAVILGKEKTIARLKAAIEKLA